MLPASDVLQHSVHSVSTGTFMTSVVPYMSSIINNVPGPWSTLSLNESSSLRSVPHIT